LNNPVVAAKFEVDLTPYLDPTGKLVQKLRQDRKLRQVLFPEHE